MPVIRPRNIFRKIFQQLVFFYAIRGSNFIARNVNQQPNTIHRKQTKNIWNRHEKQMAFLQTKAPLVVKGDENTKKSLRNKSNNNITILV